MTWTEVSKSLDNLLKQMQEIRDSGNAPCHWNWIGTICAGEHRENCGCPGTDSFRHKDDCRCYE